MIKLKLKDGTILIPTISTEEFEKEGKIPRLRATNGGWVIKPLSHQKSLVTYFMEAEYQIDETIPAFMMKTRL